MADNQKENDANENRYVDDKGYDHTVTHDDAGRVLSDKRYDKDGTLLGEGLYKNGEPIGRKEYRTDDKGLRHTITYDAENRILSDQGFDEDGTLRGESLFENGEFVGSKTYTTEYAKGGQTFDHIITRDADNQVLSDKRYDKDGTLLGEGLYKNGEPIGRKEYAKDDMGFDHVITRNADNEIVSEQKFDKNGRLMTEEKTVQNDVKTPEPEQKPAARAAAENLPSVRGNAMPERARAETSAGRGNADPNMPAVRGNAMPEKARAAENVGKEEALADSFVAFTKNRTRESAQRLFNSLRDMDLDFLRQGLTAEEMKEKMSAVMATAFDKGVAAGMNADALNKDIAAFSKQFEERLKNAAHTPEQPTATATRLDDKANTGAKSGLENVEDAEYEDVTNDPAYANAAGLPAKSAGNGIEAEKTVEKEENAAEQVAPEQARQNDGVVDTASEPEKADERGAEPAQDRPVENEPVSAAPVVEDDGNEAETADRAAPENTGNDNGGQQGGFGVAGYDDDVNTNTDENAGADGKAADDKANAAQGQDSASLDQLHAEIEAVAAKINYHMSEQDEFCPYSTIKCSSFVESKDEKNPFVQATMRPSGSTLINMPDKINIKFNTVVETDGKQNTQLTLEDCMAMVRMGMEKGWTSATLSGPPEFKKQMYLAMRAMGMEPVGYTPSAELAKQGDAMFKSNAQNREHNASIDKRFPEMESERKAAGVGIDGIDKELTDSFKSKGIGYEPKTPDEKSAESKDNTDQKDEKQSEQDSKTEEKTPQAEEKAPQVEEKAPQAEEKTPQVEEKAPQVEEKAPQSEEKTPQVEEKAPQQQEQAPLGLPNPEQGKTREQEQTPQQPQPERNGHAPLGLPNLKQQEADQHQPPAPVLPGKTQLALPALPPEKGKELNAKFTYMVEDLAAKNPQVAGYLAAGLGKADKSPSTMLQVYGGAANEVKALEVKPNTRANSNANTNLPSVIKRKGELDR